MNGVTKKQRLTKQNLLKVFYYNKIIEGKTLLSVKNNKTKQTKQLHITSNNFFEIHHFSKGEVILHYFSYNEQCL
jgi:predicted  nucleic acid-binding Zn ribbon protein